MQNLVGDATSESRKSSICDSVTDGPRDGLNQIWAGSVFGSLVHSLPHVGKQLSLLPSEYVWILAQIVEGIDRNTSAGH